MYAVINKCTDMVRLLLLHKDIDINIQDIKIKNLRDLNLIVFFMVFNILIIYGIYKWNNS